MSTNAGGLLGLDEVPALVAVYNRKGRISWSQARLKRIIRHLEDAEGLARVFGIISALDEFSKAIDLADAVDQNKLSLRREILVSQLEKDTDRKRREEMKIELACLDALRQARGFTRANAALWLLQTGDVMNATVMLMYAAAMNPKMLTDVCFRERYDNILRQLGLAPQPISAPSCPS